jgi:hypothetical protein
MTWRMHRQHWQRALIAIASVAVVSLTAWTLQAAPKAVRPPTTKKPATTSAEPTTPQVPSAPDSPNVTIVINVVPARGASVFWGKTRLGVIKPRGSLVVQRPRDSGPLDLIIRADGCLPVHTRAYTFNDYRLSVRVTPVDQKSTLLGYREELPPADAGVSGAGTPETTLESVP